MLSCQLWEKWKEIFIRCKKLRPCGLHADHCFFLSIPEKSFLLYATPYSIVEKYDTH